MPVVTQHKPDYHTQSITESAVTTLVPDDHEEHLEMVSDMPRGQGYQVLVAHDGSEAIVLLSQHCVDMAILDVTMPGSSGLEVCSLIKSDPTTFRIPVAIVTGLGSEEDRIS